MLTKHDCPNDCDVFSKKIPTSEARKLVKDQGATGLHFCVSKQDLLNLGFDANFAKDWISELDAAWIAVTTGDKNGNPRLPYME
jgi:hypothetical protein